MIAADFSKNHLKACSSNSASQPCENVSGTSSKPAESRNVLSGLSTGFENLDNLTSGLQNSALIVIASRPSMGKTAFALSLALNAAIGQNVIVWIFSLEMCKKQVLQRMLATLGKIELSDCADLPC